MTTKYSTVQNKYNKTEGKKLSFNEKNSILIVIAFISFMLFIISLPTLGQVFFCLGQEYPDLAYVESTKVCINSDTLAYIEIECSGFLRWDCERTSEEKIFRRTMFEDFSDYKILESDFKK